MTEMREIQKGWGIEIQKERETEVQKEWERTERRTKRNERYKEEQKTPIPGGDSWREGQTEVRRRINTIHLPHVIIYHMHV